MSFTNLLHDPHIEIRQKLDVEIAQLETRLVTLKLARNALAPVTRLHPEILQEIFFQTHISSTHKGRTTLLITWISHTWRTLAHNTSSLWSQIDFKHPEWVEVALSRTKSRELEFTLDGTARRGKRNLTPLIPFTIGNLSRIRRLKIMSRNAAFPPESPEWLIPAPRLVDLHLRRLSLPANVFSGVVPPLQSLYLASCGIDWDTFPISPGLKSLYISYPSRGPTIDHIVRIMQVVAPTLEELQLQYLFFQNHAFPPTTYTSRIRLDNLKTIKLGENDPDDVGVFLDQISLPPSVNIDLNVSEWHPSKVVTSLVQSRNIPKWPVDYLEIKTDDGQLNLRVKENWPTAGQNDSMETSESDTLDDSQTQTQTQTQLGIGIGIEPTQLLPIFTLLPIQPIEKVFFVGGYHVAQNSTTLECIGNMRTVRELRISLPFVRTFVVFIDEQRNQVQNAVLQGGMGERDGVISPPEGLALVQPLFSFHGVRHVKIQDDPMTGYGVLTREDVMALQSWLEWRNRLNLRVEKLTICGMRAPPIPWMAGLLDGLVDVFETKDLTEPEVPVE